MPRASVVVRNKEGASDGPLLVPSFANSHLSAGAGYLETTADAPKRTRDPASAVVCELLPWVPYQGTSP